MTYKTIEHQDRFTLKCTREDGKSVEVPVEGGVNNHVYVDLAAIGGWDPPDSSIFTEDDQGELRHSLLMYYAKEGRQVSFDDGEEAQEVPSFNLKLLNPKVVQCQRDGKTALVSVDKSVDGARFNIDINRVLFWEPPDELIELNDADFAALMRELVGLLKDENGKATFNFQSEYVRPSAAAAIIPDDDDEEEGDEDEDPDFGDDEDD